MLVLCNGMPRSGSTLQYNLVANLVEAAKAGTALGGIQDTGGTVDDLRVAATADAMLVYKTHDVLPHILPWVQRGEAGVLVFYIYRDLRDVAVSVREKHGPDETRMFGLLDSAVATYNALVPIRESPLVLWQRYEEVTQDALAATRQAAAFLGIDVAPEVAKEIAAECSVGSARRVMEAVRRAVKHRISTAPPAELREIRRGMRDGTYHAADPTTHIHWNHISRFGGASGSWRSELPEASLETITGRCADWFASAGYDVAGASTLVTEGASE